MCEACGCISETDPLPNSHHHHHNEHHDHHHSHETDGKKRIDLNTDVLGQNNKYAADNRDFFQISSVYAVNLISSPGSGKTMLVEAMARQFGNKMAVIEGDIQTRRDAERVSKAGSQAHQIETHGACHLDAHGIAHALKHVDLSASKLLIIENVGNLVCPATYDLGESEKIAVLSTPEGDDKILKYPALFHKISTLIINKIDLLPHLNFDINRAVDECRQLNPDCRVFQVSATTGEGTASLFKYLSDKAKF